MKVREYGFNRNALRARLSGVLVAIIIASVFAVGFATIKTFDRAVEPELSNRTRLIGSIIRSDIQRALDVGIPFDAIVGLDAYLEQTIHKFDELERITVSNASGQSVAIAERRVETSLFTTSVFGEMFALPQSTFSLPILDGNRMVGGIKIDINPLFVQTRLRGVLLDVMVIALIAILVALELALAVAVTYVGKPLNRVYRLLEEQRNGRFLHRVRPGGLGSIARAAARLNDRADDLAQRLAAMPVEMRSRISRHLDAGIARTKPVRLRLSDIHDIRLTLFLFSAAADVSASFLPIYARNALRPDWLTPELAAAAPLVVYLAALAVLSPFGGKLARRFGTRTLFLASVPPAALALIAMGLSESVLSITFWRGFMGVFYAMATIACQEYALRASADEGSSRPMAAFVAVVFGGLFCGSAMGGVIAGRFGFEAAFISGAAMALASGLLGYFAMRGQAGNRVAEQMAPIEIAKTRQPVGFRFVLLLIGVVVPMSASTAIFVWYLTPLMLTSLSAGPADIARVVMLYYLAAVVFGPFVAKLSDLRIGPLALVLFGALVSGSGLFSLSIWDGFWAIAIAVAVLGLGHSFMRAPLYVLALKSTKPSNLMLNALRLVERAGAILGLLVCAFLLDDFGADIFIRILAIAVLIGIAVYGAVEVAKRIQSG